MVAEVRGRTSYAYLHIFCIFLFWLVTTTWNYVFFYFLDSLPIPTVLVPDKSWVSSWYQNQNSCCSEFPLPFNAADTVIFISRITHFNHIVASFMEHVIILVVIFKIHWRMIYFSFLPTLVGCFSYSLGFRISISDCFNSPSHVFCVHLYSSFPESSSVFSIVAFVRWIHLCQMDSFLLQENDVS